GSMERALKEMERRRKKQIAYNQKYKITPKTIQKAVQELEEFSYKARSQGLSLVREDGIEYAAKENLPALIKTLRQEMQEAADNLDFELAAMLRDKLIELNA
ncbi:MAG TPA: excinuclease ABC subunit B, partial [Elusimicrobia bacterium]|nr:excinuclease ABC subunit B [Elusimicrobiota bacterium]